MRRIYILFLSMLASLAIQAQIRLNVHVASNSGESLPGAAIWVEQTFKGTITNRDGVAQITLNKSMQYTIKASYLGYEQAIQSVFLQKDTNVYFQLNVQETLTDEALVTASRVRGQTPIAYTTLDKKQLSVLNVVQDLPVLLNQTPSLVYTSDAGAGVGYTSFRIRGTDTYRINVTLNGIPLNDAESHGVFWVNMPDMSSNVDNIQIQRGVGNSTNGAGAFGATVNFQAFSLKPEAYAEIRNSFGSFATRKHAVLAGTGLINKHFTVDMQLSKINSDGYIDRAFSDMYSYSLSTGYYGKNNVLKFHFFGGHETTYQAWGGVPAAVLDTNRTFNPYTYENEVDNYDQQHYHLHYSHQFNKELNLHTALHYTRGYGYYEQMQEAANPYHQTWFSFYNLPDVVLGTDTMYQTDIIRRLHLDNHFFGGIANLHYEGKKWETTLGTSWNQYIGDHFGRIIWARFASSSNINHQWYFNQGTKTDANIFIKNNYKWNDYLNTYIDLQVRTIQFAADGSENALAQFDVKHDFTFFNPKMGINARINDAQNIFFLFAIANREPNRNNFIDAQAAGKPMPKPERLLDYELGYQLSINNLSFNTHLFYMNYKNQLVNTGEINFVGYPIMENVNNSYRTGIETSVSYKPFNFLRVDANLTYSQNKVLQFVENLIQYDEMWNQTGFYTQNLGTTDLAFSPEWIGASTITLTMLPGLDAGLSSKYVGTQFIDNTSNTNRMLDAYFLNDFFVNYQFSIKNLTSLILTIQANNITNHEYESNAWVYRVRMADNTDYTDIGYFPQAGRNYMVSVVLKF